MTTPQLRHCTIYRGRGHVDELPATAEPVEPVAPYHAPVADRVAVRSIMARDLICVRPDLEIASVVSLLIGHHIGCLPVVDERRRPIGIITKFDVVEQIDAAMQLARCRCPLPTDLTAQTADDVMMPIALALDEHATIAHAGAMMLSEDTHHVLVVDGDGLLVGVVSSKDIVRWVTQNDVLSVRRDASCGPPVWRPLEG
jgi:CBS-domain-containing membrane protein